MSVCKWYEKINVVRLTFVVVVVRYHVYFDLTVLYFGI